MQVLFIWVPYLYVNENDNYLILNVTKSKVKVLYFIQSLPPSGSQRATLIHKRPPINSDGEIVTKYFRKVDSIKKWTNSMHSFDSIHLSAYPPSLLNCKIHSYSYIRGSKGEKACTIMIPIINFASSYPNQLIDAELWLLYLSSKLVTHYHITQLSVSGHTCFNCNYKDNCLNVYCQYSYSCTCCSGMYPVMLQSNKSTIIHT